MKARKLANKLLDNAMFMDEISQSFGIDESKVDDLLSKIKSSGRHSVRKSGEMIWVKRRNKKRVKNGNLPLPLSK